MKKYTYTTETAGQNVIVITDEFKLVFNRTGNGVYQAEHGHLFATCRVPETLRTEPPHLHTWEEIPEEQIQNAISYLLS